MTKEERSGLEAFEIGREIESGAEHGRKGLENRAGLGTSFEAVLQYCVLSTQY